MIEILNEEKCILCNLCVTVCPTNVFDRVKGSAPTIARVEDCQTCFMCEAYCPTDALYVAPEADELTGVRESDLAEGIMGDYRKKVFKYDAVRRSQTSRTIG